MEVLNHFQNLGKRIVPKRNGDLNFSFHIHQAQLWSLIRNDFILFYTETYKIRRKTCLITIVFEACYLSKLGLNVEAEIQILLYLSTALLPCLKIAKKAISWQKLIM